MLDKTSLGRIRSALYVLKPAKRADFSMIGRFVYFLMTWMGTVWILWPPEADGITEEELGRSILLLFRQQLGAFQKLEQWMEQWSQINITNIPESFQRIRKQAQEAAQRDKA